jgi:hypothetical protein
MDQSFHAETVLGYAQLTSIDSSTLVSSATFGSATAAGIPAGTALLLIQPQSQAIRWRDDGTAPTATVGYPLAAGAELQYTGQGMQNLRVISQVAGAAINIVAYGAS